MASTSTKASSCSLIRKTKAITMSFHHCYLVIVLASRLNQWRPPRNAGGLKTKQHSFENEKAPLQEVCCEQRLGGMICSYSRKTA
ncbi:hypothetical protein Psta_0277 [Pirellula staleyi DSM 6068]|uniref:Uncharacterized protein n=1 Tax=Pirellula staleyi (strain ATCC 27377 / DSM 6068 / ICPB 4128) TaxID=530564 RepID=D2R1I7_PIRSD|nr:hypothetical protein Psta_0277 [Pirellula staleyi DSM 6068]